MTAAQWRRAPIPQVLVAQGPPGLSGTSDRQVPARAPRLGTVGSTAVLSGIKRWQHQGTRDAIKGSR